MTGSTDGVGTVAACAGGWRDAACWPGVTGRRRVLFHVVTVAAVASMVSSVAIAVRAGVSVTVGQFTLAIGAVALAQLARLRLRVGSDIILLTWGETGVIAALCLLPARWVPAATALGVAIGHLYRVFGADQEQRARILFAIGVLTVGASVATAVVVVANSTTPVRATLVRPETLLPLLVAAAAYFVTTSVLTSSWVASTTRGRFRTVWWRAVKGKRVMVVGNVAVGLAVALVIGADLRLLALLAPVLWLLHHAYSHQMQAAEERRTWVALADATRNLNQLEERGVAGAALRGAAQLFAPDEAEVVVLRPSGGRRAYRARTSDPTVVTVATSDAAGADELVGSGRVLVRRLLVGEANVGELRLAYRRQVRLAPRERHAFSAFADAVASALHDAATHRQLRVATARSAYEAVHDRLTGLADRSTLLARGNAELRRLDPSSPVGLLLFDVDGFRAVNDALGHAAGDQLLRLLARRLGAMYVDGDLVGRLGGDTFALVCTGVPDGSIEEGHAAYVLDRARSVTAVLARPAMISGVTIAVEVSAGVVVEAAGRCDMTEMLRRADVALHHARRAGTRIAQYDATCDAASIDRLTVLAELRDALAATDQLTVLLQPAIDLSSGAPTGAEALTRWQHPRRGMLVPAAFIDVIEQSELLAGFTRFVLDRALRIAAGWATQGVHVPISVNLASRSLLDRDLPAVVAGRLEAYGVRPDRLVLEITESVMAELAVAEEVISALKAQGVQVSVDDFGTGAASLTLLTKVPLDEVKIDRSFVANMVTSPEAAAIVRATVDLAHELGLRVVAEGVERADQRQALAALGVTAAQGFLFYPPLRLEKATAVLQGLAQAATSPTIPIVRADVA